jgi:hypothetical protein
VTCRGPQPVALLVVRHVRAERVAIGCRDGRADPFERGPSAAILRHQESTVGMSAAQPSGVLALAGLFEWTHWTLQPVVSGLLGTSDVRVIEQAAQHAAAKDLREDRLAIVQRQAEVGAAEGARVARSKGAAG